MPCTYALGIHTNERVNVSKCLSFDPSSNGQEPWNQLYTNGRFDKLTKQESEQIFNRDLACGVAASVTVHPCKSAEAEMCLVWDMPVVNFRDGKKSYTRFYTKHFGTEHATLKIVDYAFRNYRSWEKAIHKWQQGVLDNK